MNCEHGLIRAETAEWAELPDWAKLFLDINGSLYMVKKVIKTSKGLRACVKLPEGTRRLPVNPEDILVVTACDISGQNTDDIRRNSRGASIPLRGDLELYLEKPSIYAGIHCG
jgi:hypothetical protein